jgi:WD40 repeat protein
MFRWICVCLLLSAAGIGAVWFLVPQLYSTQPPDDSRAVASDKKPAADQPAAPQPQPPAPGPRVASSSGGSRVQPEMIVFAVQKKDQPLTEPIIIPNGTLVIVDQQEVPSEKEGIIMFIGTDVKPGEVVPPEKQLPEAHLGFLAVPVVQGETPLEGETFFRPKNNADGPMYRRLRETDQMLPERVVLFREDRKVRKLQRGDPVKRGQLLALVKPDKAFEAAASNVAKLNAKEYERKSAETQRDEYGRRYRNQLEINRKTPGAIPQDDIEATRVQKEKAAAEEKVKRAEITVAQRELSAALNDLKNHEVHAAIDGVVQLIYKNHQGDAVKPNEPIMQIQNPARLRVQGFLEMQEALKLKEGMPVIVEATRPEPPRLVISGHLNAVNSVAVSKGKRPIIVSGSDDETLRGWDSQTGDKLWLLTGLNSPVRAVACTPKDAKRNLACFGCNDGRVRLLNLEDVNRGPHELAGRHRGAVIGVAFSPDGEVCASCGDDRTICLWKTETGELLHRLSYHNGPVTSVYFASAKRLVSAGKDYRLAVWDVEAGKPPHRVGPNFDGRSGDVSTIGASPDGRLVLFDQGKELKLLTLEGKQMEGTLQNPADASNFSTMALFSPDGKTILTNGSQPGKLQLWRTPVEQARASELRQFIWAKGTATCGAFAPEDGSFAVTGTQDNEVLVWTMPSKEEVDSRLEAHLTYVEKNLGTQSRQVQVWAELQSPEWLIPGMKATMVVLPPRK